MCGLAGILHGSPVAREGHTECLQGMLSALVHRGPDDTGIWADIQCGVALGHRRLAILDTSPSGHQPMVSACGRYVITFNGEIYNHLELRQKLNDVGRWLGHSDTETLLAAIAAWGIEMALQRCVGMFAFAVWDRTKRSLTLARDRMGEKPLYYGWQGQVFLFGSELKALCAHPAFDAEIDRNALTLLLRHSYIPSPYSVYRGIHKLPPGTWLTLRSEQRDAQPVPYWSMQSVAGRGMATPFAGSVSQAVDELERLLDQSLAGQMMADVPLGAFLSGGVDSSTIVALMQVRASRPVKTFSIGFYEAGYNEAENANAVARHLGTEHTEFYVTPQEVMAIISRLPTIYDEPFSDASQLPTLLVSQLASKHVTVALSGDGGDELFGGYNRYTTAMRVTRMIDRLPSTLRKQICRGLEVVPAKMWDHMGRWTDKGELSEKVRKLTEIIDAPNLESLYRQLVSHWKQPEQIVIDATEPETELTRVAGQLNFPDFEHRMMYLDTVSYLPDDVLAKVDRAAMATSLETRVPLLDHRLVRFAWRLPLSLKIRDGQGKWILRQVLYRHVPRELIERPKMGFGVPVGDWLRGPLRDWAENLLDESRLRQEGFFNSAPIRKKWSEHLSGERNWQYHIWDVLMFQAWLEQERKH